MDPQYDIYFAGEVLDGHDPASVRAALGKLFKADEDTLDRLFSGKVLAIKRGCDKATALKYKESMERVGANPVIRAAKNTAEPTPAQAPPPAPETPPPAEEKPMSAAERIAALAAAPDELAYRSEATAAPTESSEISGDDGMEVAPAGADVLRPEERPVTATVEVDTSGLDVDEAAQRLSEEPPPPPPAPDTSHMAMGEVGETIPVLEGAPAPAAPSIDHLGLSPEGTDFSDCAAPDPESPDLDLSGMDLAPAGSEVLEEQYRKREQPPQPDTDHLSLED